MGDENLVEIVKDNTDVNKLRRRLVDIKLAFKESMDREVSRIFEEIEDLDTEIQEGMSNRVGSGFMANEAKKYAYRLIKPVMRDTLQDLDGIKADLVTDIASLVGEEFVQDPEQAMGGLIGNASQKNFEQSELEIKVLEPPA
jgi:hypothetical protein